MSAGGEQLAVFRFDAGPHLGGGHAMRCLTLAEGLRHAGWQCRFAVAEGTLETVPRLHPYSADCLELAVAPDEEPDQIGSWLDAEGCDLLVSDHYQRDAGFEHACRSVARLIMVIDDLADRDHDADLLLDQNLGRAVDDYKDRVPAHCRMLIGPRYALLRPGFAACRDDAIRDRSRRAGVERILISLGLADPRGLTLQALRAVRDCGFSGDVDVVVGGGAPDIASVHQLAAEMGNRVRVLSDVEDMAWLMRHADLAIGAGGSTAWERCALGLPSIVCVIAENQRAIAAALGRAGAGVVLDGDVSGLSRELTQALKAILSDPARIEDMRAAAAEICDGLGVSRVMEALR